MAAPVVRCAAMRSVVLGIIVIELLMGGSDDAGRNTATA